jgi:exodeoxyribonuclease V gamma subunit
MSLTVYTGNRMERLADQLAALLESPLRSPLAEELIVVQSGGMERWLAMELARRYGVWANCRYPFPNKFISDLFGKCMPDLRAGASFEPGLLLWRIMGLLDRFRERDECCELKTYLAGAGSGLKSYQLASRIADTFDQYTLFRSDLLAEWEAGGGEGWQPLLWRTLVGEGRGLQRGRVQAEFLQRLADGRIDRALLPERITVFGISYLPIFHLQVLAHLAASCQVNLFVMSPCREYWGDILPERTRLKLSPARRATVDEGNALLASLGRLGRDFSNLILALDDVGGCQQDLYREAEGDSLLARLQNDILNLRNAPATARIRVSRPDRSIAFHSCHSPMREIEVLHDNLLELFARERDLRPRDILVMTPSIESYAPYIAAVFDPTHNPANRIPYSIADRSIRSEGRLGQTLLAILELPGKRFGAAAVMDILACCAVQSRFGMFEQDLAQVRSWLDQTHIRWGMDESERQQAGLPPYREQSWMAGLERLLLGYAMPGDNRLFDEILPFDNMEGDAPLLLGRLVSFVTQLHGLAGGLERPRGLADWAAELQGIMEQFFEPEDQDAGEAATIASLIGSLTEMEGEAAFSGQVGLDLIRSWLQGRLESEGRGLGFLSGGVTFCAMLPMRSIPFRVIALIGMNDGAFPRQNRGPGFDLISSSPRPGDRSLRDEDRYLFLESILSCRQRLLISYIGQSISDNSALPPSVLVSELLDYLEARYEGEDGQLSAGLITRHRLQPFSPDYFTGRERLFSYSRENFEAVTRQLAPKSPAPAFISGELPPAAETLSEIRLEELLRFYSNPAACLLAGRLGIRLEEPAGALEEREPFEIDGLAAYGLKQEIIEQLLAGGDQRELYPLARARGILPPARQGELAFERVAGAALDLAQSVRACIAGEDLLEALDFDLQLAGFRIRGRLDGLRSGRLLRYRCARLSARDQIRLWIEHLFLNLLAGEGYPRFSTLIMSDGRFGLTPVADAGDCLTLLLEHYRDGMKRPLRFFPRSSLAYLKAGRIEDAERVWNAERFPESGDPAYRLCFGEQNPFDEEFCRVAEDVFGPCLRHREGSNADI